MREKVVQKLYKNGCTNIISLLPTTSKSPQTIKTRSNMHFRCWLLACYASYQIIKTAYQEKLPDRKTPQHPLNALITLFVKYRIKSVHKCCTVTADIVKKSTIDPKCRTLAKPIEWCCIEKIRAKILSKILTSANRRTLHTSITKSNRSS